MKTKTIGNNGVLFGKGYKGPGMCENCNESVPMKNGKGNWCSHYAAPCRKVSRNCPGIRWFKSPTPKEKDSYDPSINLGFDNPPL